MTDHFNWCVDHQTGRDMGRYSLPRISQNDQEVVTRMYYGLQAAVGNVLHKRSKDGKCYSNVSFSHNFFMHMMRAALKVLKKLDVNSPKFLDVGCGLGTSLFLAQKEGFEAWGLDRNKTYLKIARELLQGVNRLIHQDAFRFNRYNEFDCIYWYTPIRGKEEMCKLELMICEQAKMPCVLAAAFDMGNIIHRTTNVRELDFDGNSSRLYLKCTDEQWRIMTEKT